MSEKITALTEQASGTLADDDLFVDVDVSDTTMAPTGTNKKSKWSSIKATLKTYFDSLYATAAQGGLADTAVQPGDLGTAAYADTGDFATAAQGAKADSALQPAEVKSANFTAANDGVYVVVATATVTDPSPTEGKGFQVIVRNGTATVGGTAYATAGLQIRRLYHSGAWANYVDVLTTDARLSDARTPTAHAASHVNGTDDIQDATASQKGLMTAAYATKLDGIEASADVTDAANVGSSINGATAKTTPVDGDTMPLIDSAASNVLKKVTWANIKATLKTYFDTLYAKIGDVTASGMTMGTGKVLARTTASTGAIEEKTVSELLDTLGSSAQGDIAYRGASGWALLPAGANGEALLTQGAGANPQWGNPSPGTVFWSDVQARPQTKALTSNVTSTSTSLADVTGLTITVGATGTYSFEVTGVFTSSVTTEGIKLAMNGPASSFIFLSVAFGATTTYVNSLSTYSAWDDGPTIATTGGSTPREFRIAGVFTATATGTLAVRFAAETGGANSATVNAGTFFTMTPAD